MFLRKTTRLPLLLFLSLASCEEESTVDAAKLEGQWFIQEGLRDGAQSDAFDGAYLRFSGERMVTNLPIPDPNFTEVPMGFSVSKDILTQKPEGVEGLDLKISALTDSLLVLDFELRKTAFHLVFGRTAPVDSISVGTPF